MDTPFVYDRYVTGKNFIGRKTECNILGNLLEAGEQVVIYEPPKSGKMSVVQQTLYNMRSAGKQFVVAWVNLFNVRTLEDFLVKYGTAVIKPIFSTPTEIVTKLKSVDQVDVPYPLSWVDEERDISCWLGNVMQREAFNKLYSVAERVHLCTDRRIKQDWDYMQASNNFRFMTTKNTGVTLNRGIYDSPFDAFTNYMNILGDFISRVNSLYPVDMDNETPKPITKEPNKRRNKRQY